MMSITKNYLQLLHVPVFYMVIRMKTFLSTYDVWLHILKELVFYKDKHQSYTN